MVNRTDRRGCWIAVLLLAGAVLSGAAWCRGGEYDEQYTLFLTAGTPRPAWPRVVFPAGTVRTLQAGHAGLGEIARDLRRTDVHPPLYFWLVALWRDMAGDGLFAARFLSVLCSLIALILTGVVARQTGVPAVLAMALTLGCYGFTYTGVVARGFALAQMLNLAGIACLLGARGRWWAALRAHREINATAGKWHPTGFPVSCPGLARAPTTYAVETKTWVAGRSPAEGRGQGSGMTPRGRSPAPNDAVAPWQSLIGGLLLGAATFTNYLAVFTGLAALAGVRVRGSAAALAGFIAILPLDLWFFLAQRNSRVGQFPPFHWLPALERLGQYSAANLLGGLPLYVGPSARTPANIALGALLITLFALIILRWRHVGRPEGRLVLALAAVAPPCGLLGLGLAFDNTPIELRYLAFATPFVAMLLAGALKGLPRIVPALVLSIQAAAIAGLILRSETMQPASAAAAAAAALAGDGVVLLPGGNDGVGIVGAFAAAAPPALPLMIVTDTEAPDEILSRVAPYRRVTLALLAQDAASRATVPAMRSAFASPCWRRIAEGFNVTTFQRVCEGE